MNDSTPSLDDLKGLEQLIQRDLEILDYPSRNWIPKKHTPNGTQILEALIIGGGQGGLSIAFGLMREKVDSILVLDENPSGFEGPWRTFARMPTLRTPKYLTGPDQGIPNLSFRSWFEAQSPTGAWSKLDFIPREMWADYLNWFRTFLKLPVRNRARAGSIEWRHDLNCFEIPVLTETESKPETLFAKRIVLATGIDGSGKWDIPRILRSLPKSVYAHTRETIDFQNLRGKKIGVLGAGASAFDNAAVALEYEASEVHLFFRRDRLPNVNPYRWAEFVGFLKHHSDLADSDRWRFILQIVRMGQLPPRDTFQRCKRFKNFEVHPNSPCIRAESIHSGVRIFTPQGFYDFDFLIVGSGFTTDLSLRPELKNIYSQIALWKDRFSPPDDEKNVDLLNHPYLGSNFDFQPKNPNSDSHITSIFNYNFGCFLSLGLGGSSISGMKYSIPKIISGITQQIYKDDREFHFNSLKNFNEIEFNE